MRTSVYLSLLNIDDIGKIDEVRIGFRTVIFDELLKQQFVYEDDVSYSV